MGTNLLSLATMEEAHWLSFRDAVACLQHTLEGDLSVSGKRIDSAAGPELNAANELAGRGGIQSDYDQHESNDSKSTECAQRQCPESLLDDANDIHQTTSTDVVVGDTSTAQKNVADISYYATNYRNNSQDGTDVERMHQPPHQLELIGLEELHKKRGHNDLVNDDIMFSPTNAHSQASHTTNKALSIAESQLAETKLKLAMTESERDELEFQLLQSR